MPVLQAVHPDFEADLFDWLKPVQLPNGEPAVAEWHGLKSCDD